MHPESLSAAGAARRSTLRRDASFHSDLRVFERGARDRDSSEASCAAAWCFPLQFETNSEGFVRFVSRGFPPSLWATTDVCFWRGRFNQHWHWRDRRRRGSVLQIFRGKI